MTLGGVRDFFRTQLNALNYREWTDAFVVENIPSTILDGSYHLDVGHIQITRPMGGNGTAYEISFPVTIKVFSKGYRHAAAAIDGALDDAQAILAALLDPSVRLSQTMVGLKDIRPSSIDTKPLQVSNEHCVILVMGFSAYLILSF